MSSLERFVRRLTSFVTADEADQIRGTAVVIDVLRAFTTAAVCLTRGARAIALVERIEDAFELRDRNRDWILMGEKGGLAIPGFNFSNSPVELSHADVNNRVIVHRTTSGTRAAVSAMKHASDVYCASLVCAASTAGQLDPNQLVIYILSGSYKERAAIDDGDDDHAVAEVIDDLRHGEAEYGPCIQRIKSSRAAALLIQDGLDPADIALSCQPNAYPTPMRLVKKSGLVTILP